jgi:hypothetical protein
MSSAVTLNLSEATIERAQAVAKRTGSTLEMVLMDWIERGAEVDDTDISPLMTGHTYHIYTPLGMERTARGLYELLNSKDDDE